MRGISIYCKMATTLLDVEINSRIGESLRFQTSLCMWVSEACNSVGVVIVYNVYLLFNILLINILLFCVWIELQLSFYGLLKLTMLYKVFLKGERWPGVYVSVGLWKEGCLISNHTTSSYIKLLTFLLWLNSITNNIFGVCHVKTKLIFNLNMNLGCTFNVLVYNVSMRRWAINRTMLVVVNWIRIINHTTVDEIFYDTIFHIIFLYTMLRREQNLCVFACQQVILQ